MRAPLDWFAGALAGLPPGWTEALGEGAGWCLGAVVRYRRVEALAAMGHGLPGHSEADRRRVLARMYRHLGRTAAEALRLACGRGDRLLAATRLVGMERVDRLRERGRGVLALCAHVGNWELFGARTATAGYPCAIVVKEFRSPAVQAFVTRSRARYGNRLLPRHDSFRECLRVLRDNGIVALMLDQNMIRSEGVFVDFLGRPACTTPGLAYLSARSGAPVVPAFCLRRPGGGHEVRIGEPFEPPPDRRPDTIRDATQAYSRAVEAVVREHPDQWTWIHRRWRTRPLAYAEGGRPGDRG